MVRVKKEKETKIKKEKRVSSKNLKMGREEIGKTFFVVGLFTVFCAISFAVGMVEGAKFLYDDAVIDESLNKVDINQNFDDELVVQELTNLVDELKILDSYNRSFESVDNLSNIELLYFSFNKLFPDGWSEEAVVSLADINIISQRYFNRSVVGENLPCDITATGGVHEPAFIYDANTQLFMYNSLHGGHGTVAMDVLNKVVSVKYVSKNIYEVYVNKAFSLNEYFFVDYYPTYQDAYQKTNMIFSDTNFNTEYYKEYNPMEDFNKVPKDKLVTYKYTFEKNGERFILKDYRMD